MINFINFITLLRGPLAFFFLSDSIYLRTLSIAIAMLSDSLDGYLARRYQAVSRLGTILDPLMDKIFVMFVMGIFLWEGALTWWNALALISRDIAILFFGLFLLLKRSWSRFEFQSIWSGKITTTLQFFVLIALTFRYPVLPAVYGIFIVLGSIFWGQLYLINKAKKKESLHPK